MRRLRGDDGAYAILYGITIVLVLAFAGIVVDINSARADRRLNRTAADAASLAAATQLRSDAPKPREACIKAVAYLNDNLRGATLAATVCDPFPVVVSAASPCPPSAVIFTPIVSGDFRVTMTWPVVSTSPLLEKPDVRPGNATQTEDTVFDGTADDRCQRFAVSVAQDRDFLFGPVVGGPAGTTTGVSSVGRSAPMGESGDAAAALILLERMECNVLEIPNTGPTVVVQGNMDRPGIIHADSDGSGGSCGGSKIFHVQQDNVDIIKAAHAETGATPRAQGIISTVALNGGASAVPANAYTGTPGRRVKAAGDPLASPPLTLAQQTPIGRPLVTRGPVDKRYRLPVKDLIGEAQAAWGLSAAAAATAGYTVKPTCNLKDGSFTEQKIFVDCDKGPVNINNFTFSAGDATVVFNKAVSVGSGNFFNIPDARKVFIRGELESKGPVNINAGAEASCAARQAASPLRTAAVVLDGGLASSAAAAYRLCSTTVVFAKCAVPTSDATLPTTNACTDNIRTNGGAIDWSAPNTVSGPPTPADFLKLEDLALWGEASEDMKMNGNGGLKLSGIFFLPNADPFDLGGTGSVDVVNSQLIVRRLSVSGDSEFSFKPNPNDVVNIPFFGGVSLIR